VSKLAFSTLSIHPHPCQGAPPPSPLSSRPKRSVVESLPCLSRRAVELAAGAKSNGDLRFHCRTAREQNTKPLKLINSKTWSSS
jgi:hypothetical protein